MSWGLLSGGGPIYKGAYGHYLPTYITMGSIHTYIEVTYLNTHGYLGVFRELYFRVYLGVELFSGYLGTIWELYKVLLRG
jgi:hypothetical protein